MYMEKLRMKMLLALTLTTVVLAACATQDKITTLENAGSSFGTPMPKWMEVFARTRSVTSLAKLPEYAGNYCFIAEEFDIGSTPQVLQQLIRWSDQFSAQQKIGQTISSTIASTFQANENQKPDGPEAMRQYNAALGMISQATYSGARKEGDWWIKERVESKGIQPVIRYRVIALYIIPKEQLNRQIENKLKEIAKENPAMAAVVDAVTSEVLQKGLEWTPVEAQPVSTATR
jgi:hypothetical protein